MKQDGCPAKAPVWSRAARHGRRPPWWLRRAPITKRGYRVPRPDCIELFTTSAQDVALLLLHYRQSKGVSAACVATRAPGRAFSLSGGREQTSSPGAWEPAGGARLHDSRGFWRV